MAKQTWFDQEVYGSNFENCQEEYTCFGNKEIPCNQCSIEQRRFCLNRSTQSGIFRIQEATTKAGTPK